MDSADRIAIVTGGIGRRALAVPADVSRGPGVQALAAAAECAFGPVDLFCSNVGTEFWVSRLTEDDSPGGYELWATSMSLSSTATSTT
jgi:NAD(P)-dependent dehydrogenase (short-subunit alcohol dehydrogenase family)